MGQNRRSVAVIEVGVGPNTPVVTSIPAVAFASAVAAAGGRATYLRVNPDARSDLVQGNTPADTVSFHSWRSSWESLQPLVTQVLKLRANNSSAPGVADKRETEKAQVTSMDSRRWQQQYIDILLSLRTPR